MSKRSIWSVVALVAFFSVGSARAADTKTGVKGLTIGGDIEAGYTNSWVAGGAKDSGWGVDEFNLKTTYEVTDKTKVVFNTMSSAMSGTAFTGASSPFLTEAYFPRRTLLSAAAASNEFAFGVTDAYVEQAFTENIRLAAGYFHTGFGMENLTDRYDIQTYMYSYAFSSAFAYGWEYDTGLRLSLVDVIPGHLDIEVVDGRNTVPPPTSYNTTPGFNLRYWYEWKNGDMTITPVISTVLNSWHGGPSEVGVTAGTMGKFGPAFMNLEWVYTSRSLDPSTSSNSDKVWDIYAEPGYDLGILQVSAKVDYINATAAGAPSSTTDWNVGGAISHTYNDKYRIRAVYEHGGLSGNLAGAGLNLAPNQPAHVNHILVLFGTKF